MTDEVMQPDNEKQDVESTDISERTERIEPETADDSGGDGEDKSGGLAVWLQFPRRVVILLIAFALANGLVLALRGALLETSVFNAARMSPEQVARLRESFDWSQSIADRGTSVSELIGERLGTTLGLLFATLVTAVILAAAYTAIAVLVHRLEEKSGAVGSVLKALGRWRIFSWIGAPVFWLALLFLFIFAIKFGEWGLPALPVLGRSAPGSASAGDRLLHLILPTAAMALLPAGLSAQAAARAITLPRENGGARAVLGGICKGLAVLFTQTGGILGALIIVETVFARAGIGTLLFTSVIRLDLPVFTGVLRLLIGLTLAGRLLAELLHALARALTPPIADPRPEPFDWRVKARRIWVIIALVLLVIPLLLALSGLATSADAALMINSRAILSSPSAKFPLGTDNLGRDIFARLRRGALVTTGFSLGAALLAFVPAALGGLLGGWLESKHTFLFESLADLILLPAEALLLIPALPGAMLLLILVPADNQGLTMLLLVLALLLTPRLVKAFQSLWLAAPGKRTAGLVVAALGSILLGGVFGALHVGTALSYLGLGVRPPTSSLGSMIGEASRVVFNAPHVLIWPGLTLWVLGCVFYTAADALVGYFDTKETMAHLNQ